MLQYLKEAGYSLYSALKGLRVTTTTMRRAETTVQYPEVRPDLAPRFRGLPEVDLNICIVCHLCEKACPTSCIHIEEIIHQPSKDPDAPKEKKKEARVFDINAALCMFCGLCEESCPTKPVKSIALNHNFELARDSRLDLVYGRDGQYVNAPINPPEAK